MNLHKDVLEAIHQDYVRRMSGGELLKPEELIDLMNVAFLLTMPDIKEIEKFVRETKKYLLDNQQDIRIYNLFLENHGLSEEFDLFYYRIMRRLHSKNTSKKGAKP